MHHSFSNTEQMSRTGPVYRTLFKFTCYQCTLSGQFAREYETCPRCRSGFCTNNRIRHLTTSAPTGEQVTFLPWRFHRVTRYELHSNLLIAQFPIYSNAESNPRVSSNHRTQLERVAEPREIGEKCSICFEEIQLGDGMITLHNCTHTYHAACILQWTQNKNNCPQCCRVAFNE